MSAISLRHVTKAWGATNAVDDVSFDVRAGSLVVLLGPSGCGKSTTLRLIAGLESLTSGVILIGGDDVTNLPPAERHISMVFQSYALFPHLSVLENIVFGLRVRRVPAVERKARLARVATLLGLELLLDRKPSQLSGGQQQRVALGRAIIAEKPVCLMDEPLSNLDAQLRAEMRREIRALQQKLGMTMLYVTHDQTEAMTMADQVILLENGRVAQDATPAALYARPASVFAARFIGTPPMNVLPLMDGPAGAVLEGTEGPTVLEGKGAGLLLGVRPEDVTLGGTGGIAARVVSAEYLGADSLVVCGVGQTLVTARVPGGIDVVAGAEIRLGWSPAVVHVFDATTGRRHDDAAATATATRRAR
ncbi:MAG: ABC transporter ATP-binding protein [Candidatus Rokuibacteriota bacterium]|nr:MAG: ABC transporter ATP-binding protein [Candidatus Rokubacteria bacterium]